MLVAVSMSALMASAGISSGPAAFPFLSVMMAFLISAFVGLSQLMGSYVSAGGVRGGTVQQFPEVPCPSLQLFLGCREWVSIFILYWLVCLLEFVRQLLGYQVWVFEVPLSGCFLCLTGQVFDVIPFVLPMLLFTSPSAVLYSICAFALAALVRLVFRSVFLFFLAFSFWMVSGKIHSLCWVALLPRTSSHVLCQSFLLSSHCVSMSVSLPSVSSCSSWNLLERLT